MLIEAYIEALLVDEDQADQENVNKRLRRRIAGAFRFEGISHGPLSLREEVGIRAN